MEDSLCSETMPMDKLLLHTIFKKLGNNAFRIDDGTDKEDCRGFGDTRRECRLRKRASEMGYNQHWVSKSCKRAIPNYGFSLDKDPLSKSNIESIIPRDRTMGKKAFDKTARFFGFGTPKSASSMPAAQASNEERSLDGYYKTAGKRRRRRTRRR